MWSKFAVAVECEHITRVFVKDFRDQDGWQFWFYFKVRKRQISFTSSVIGQTKR